MKIDTKISANIIRYARPACYLMTLDKFDNPAYSNMGGITFIFNINHFEKTLTVKYSICKFDENFDKAAGIGVAIFCVPMTIKYDQSYTLIDNVINALNTGYDNLSTREKTLYKELYSICINNADVCD